MAGVAAVKRFLKKKAMDVWYFIGPILDGLNF